MGFVTLLCLALTPMLAGSAQALQQRGLHVFGHEVRTIQLCGNSPVYWVRASQHIRDRLESEHQRLTSQPYQEIYLEFSGELVSGAREGFAADYDGIMDVTEIHEISARVPENCRDESSKEVGKPNRRPTPRTFAFACDGDYQFVVRIEGEKAWVFRFEGTVGLPQVPSGSGAKYSDGSVTFWAKGQEALLKDRSKTHRRCRNNPRRAVWEHAKLKGRSHHRKGRLQ